MGGLKGGETAYVTFGGDGTTISRGETATAHTVKLSNQERALQIGSISIVSGAESYAVRIPGINYS